MSKISIDFIIDILKDGGYLSFYKNYDSSKVSGYRHLSGGALQGLSLMAKNGAVLYELSSIHIIDQVKEKIELREEHWSHKQTNSHGVEYYAVI